jgi:protein-disulfide isomerase
MASSQKTFYAILGVLVIGGGIIIATRMAGPRNISFAVNPVVTVADTSGFRGYLLGSPTAPVEITEYADFECPHCADFEQVQLPDFKLRLIDPGKVRLRFRDLPFHDHSVVAAHAAACADEQGKYWPANAAIFDHQNDWAFKTNPISALKDAVASAGVDGDAWTKCMESKKYAGRIQASLAEGNQLKVGSTPSFLINGRIYDAIGTDVMVKIVDSLIATGVKAAPDSSKPTGGQ